MATELQRLDALITWYQINKPESGMVIDVPLSPTKFGKLIKKLPLRGGIEFDYRGRTVRAIGYDHRAARFRGGT